jgi:glycosyltransferase involved in cell wall biosynthesis
MAARMLYHKAGKRYFVTFTGSDVRDPELELRQNPFFKFAFFHPLYEGRGIETSVASFRNQLFFSSKNFRLIANPEVAPFIRKDLFGNFPIAHHASHSFGNLAVGKRNEKVKIVHGPSSFFAKGTNYVLESIRVLENRLPGQFEFMLITGKSNEEYLEHLASADIFIDQLVWGWYGIAAVQAMEMGKVTVAYLGDKRLSYVPDCPVQNVNINNLAEVLEKLILSEPLRISIGQQSLLYYQKYHHPKEVAKSTVEFYNSMTPANKE